MVREILLTIVLVLGLNLAWAIIKSGSRRARPAVVRRVNDSIASAGRSASTRSRATTAVIARQQAFLALQHIMTTGDTQNAEVAVQLCARAVQAGGFTSAEEKAEALDNLGMALQILYQRTGDSSTLLQADRFAREAFALVPATSPHILEYHHNRAVIQFLLFNRTQERPRLDTAIGLLRAIEDRPGAATARMWSDYALCLNARSELDRSRSDYDAAIIAYRNSVDLSQPGQERGQNLSNLGAGIVRYAKTLPDPGPEPFRTALAELDAAIREFAEHRVVLPWHTATTRVECLWRWFENGGGEEARRKLIDFCRTGLPGDRKAAMAEQHLLICTHLANAYARGQDWAAASDAFALALDAIRDMAELGVDWWADLGAKAAVMASPLSDAVAAAVLAGRPDHAIRAAESGRAVLATSALTRDADLNRLGRAHPDLARRWRELQVPLEKPGTMVAWDRSPIAVRQSRARLAREIRRIEGFGDFGRGRPAPTRFAGTSAILAASEYGCFGVLTRAGRSRVVELPTRRATVAAQTEQLFVAARQQSEARAAGVMRWGWRSVARPVLDAARITVDHGVGTPPDRIWWCPLGAFSFLPIHAFADEHGSVFTRAVSSYAASPLLLGQPVTVTNRPRTHALLVDRAPGQDRLPGAAREVDELKRRYPETETHRDAGAEEVLDILGRADVVHLACHAFQDATGNGHAGLTAQDGDVLADLIAARTRGGRLLAYASACSTAVGKTRGPDEVYTLGGALQAAGFVHVIGTLWPANDAIASRVARAFYGRVIGPDGVWAETEIARALHEAVREVRTTGGYLAWAPYVHFGP